MNRIWKSVLPSLLAANLVLGQNNQSPSPGWAIVHVTIIDATGAPAKTNMTVVIADNRIAEIGKTDGVPLRKDARVVNGAGKFLIPGLWDMHVHAGPDKTWGREVFLPLFVANGITGVRDMGGPVSGDAKAVLRLRQQIREGRVLGPRIVAGYMLEGGVKTSKSVIRVSSASDGRGAVVAVKNSGADFVKLYDLVPREAYFAIADEARKQAIPFAGHLPFSVNAAEAADAGQRSIEHDYGILASCSTNAQQFRDTLRRNRELQIAGKLSLSEYFKKLVQQIVELDASYSDRQAEELFGHLAKRGTWVCPTFTVVRAVAFGNDPGLGTDPRLRYIPLPLRNGSWNLKSNPLTRDLTAGDYAAFRRNLDKWLETAGQMRRAGVRFLAGTDNGFANIFPGFSLHDELALFAQAGFPPMEALQSATRNPAEFLGLLDRLGTIETGKVADMILLDANPLEDITNTRQIAGVWWMAACSTSRCFKLSWPKRRPRPTSDPASHRHS